MHPGKFLENPIEWLIHRRRFELLDVNLYELFKDDLDFIDRKVKHFDFLGHKEVEEKTQKLLLGDRQPAAHLKRSF